MGKKPKPWSITSAAKGAREARIQTAEFLASSTVARTWQRNKLLHEFQRLLAAEGHPTVAKTTLYGGMGFSRPYPDAEQAAERILRAEAHQLGGADLYVMTPHMCDVVIAAAHSLTMEDLQLVGEDDLPSRTGMVMLPHPLIVSKVGGDLSDERAFAWHTPTTVRLPRDGRPVDEISDQPGVGITSYHDMHGPVQPDSWAQEMAKLRRSGVQLPPLILDAVRILPFHATDMNPDVLDRYIDAATHVDGQKRDWGAAQGQDLNRVVGEYTPGDYIEDPDGSFAFRFLYAFWRLCEQRLAAISAAPINHSTQLRADRTGYAPEVRVVKLRRADTRDAESPPSGREWHHRWVVRMHKVRQWYPSLAQHKVIYRGPYVKGPADKPLLGGETVRGLTR